MIIGGRTCRSCAHRHIAGPGQGIFCKRYPPQVLIVPTPGPNGQIQAMIQSAYPTVNPDLLCGEYSRNETYAMDEVDALAQGARPQ